VGTEENMKSGIVESVQPHYQSVVRVLANGVMSMTRHHWPVWNEGIDCAHKLRGIEHAENLVLYSLNDPMCLPESMKKLTTGWSRLNFDCTSHHWEKSEHAAHLVFHKEEYMKHFENKFQNRFTLTQL